MKKILYTGVLIGTIILAGCSVNEETEGQVNAEATEGLTDGQTEEVEALSVTDKGEVEVSEDSLDLTQEQKEDYYKQYLVIVEDLKVEYQAPSLELLPFDEILEENWMEPEELRERTIASLENH